MKLKNLTWEDVDKYLATSKTIIIPLGSIEQHGPSLPLGTDSIIAENLANEVGNKTNILVAPVLSPGISLIPHMEFKGTISFLPRTYTEMIIEFVTSLYSHGFRNFLLINGHGGNDGAIKNAITHLCYTLNDLKFLKP